MLAKDVKTVDADWKRKTQKNEGNNERVER